METRMAINQSKGFCLKKLKSDPNIKRFTVTEIKGILKPYTK